MNIKFDVYTKQRLGVMFKENEVDIDGCEANVNIDLTQVDRMEINYKVGDDRYTDDVLIKDERTIMIPFKSDVVKKGTNEFEVVAYMKNGDIKISQTYSYGIAESIGSGQSVQTVHFHENLDVLNSITKDKIIEWDNKSDEGHRHVIGDIDGLELVTTPIVDSTLNLTTDKYQTTTIENNTTIVLPIIDTFTEIHLFFNTTETLTLIFPSIKWQTQPSIEANKTYEFIFTHMNNTWLGGYLKYE